MNIKDYQAFASRTRSNLGSKEKDNLHMIFGIVTESGELADAFKKNFAYSKEIDWVNVEEEIGDLMWYIINFCDINNIDINLILEKNIKKLESRYKGKKFTEEEAINRDLKSERKTLE